MPQQRGWGEDAGEEGHQEGLVIKDGEGRVCRRRELWSASNANGRWEKQGKKPPDHGPGESQISGLMEQNCRGLTVARFLCGMYFSSISSAEQIGSERASKPPKGT